MEKQFNSFYNILSVSLHFSKGAELSEQQKMFFYYYYYYYYYYFYYYYYYY